MSPIRTPWTRLIRFIASETGRIHIGQPVDSSLDVGLAAWQKQLIQAHEIQGSPFDPKAKLTSKILTVKQLLSPLSRDEVGTVRCLGLNYEDHAKEANLAPPPVPILFFKPTTALTDPTAPILVPRAAQPVDVEQSDYEVELTVVIGKPMRDVKEEDALDYVLGYTAGNDVSFRKQQMITSQWGFSKGFDDASPWGPCIVAAHALPDPQNLALKCIVNGQALQDGTTKDQIFSVAHSLAWLSRGTTLLPGSILMTGTPAGVGFTRKPPIYIKHNDKIQVWIDGGIGSCINTVVEEGKDNKAKL